MARKGGPSGPVSGPNPTSGPGPTLYVPGQVIADRYQLLRQLGQGGIGQVWLAKSQTLHNEVALKLFLRGGPGDGAERLLREARAAAALEHPAIVRVFDYGETDRGDPFLVMEHLKGESLDDLLRRVGPLQPSRALKLLLPILDALSLAHGKQIIHRDIKPGTCSSPWTRRSACSRSSSISASPASRAAARA
jgi:serine/threonine protein kinase